MARTTADMIGKIVEVDLTIDLTPFIDAANLLVTEVCVDGGAEYSEARLTMIETWLAGHFYRVRDPFAQSESAGGVSASFMGSAGMQLQLTKEGQQVLLLDTTGGFAALNSIAQSGRKRRVGALWCGS
jgi:hypothetical protein